jgi:hypothetical protein
MTQARENKVHVWSEETIPAVRRINPRDTDAVALRFTLAEMLGRLRYGDEVRIDEPVVMTCWPPTGDYDRSDAALIMHIWDGTGDPEGWHRHPKSHRRRNLQTGEEWVAA